MQVAAFHKWVILYAYYLLSDIFWLAKYRKSVAKVGLISWMYRVASIRWWKWPLSSITPCGTIREPATVMGMRLRTSKFGRDMMSQTLGILGESAWYPWQSLMVSSWIYITPVHMVVIGFDPSPLWHDMTSNSTEPFAPRKHHWRKTTTMQSNPLTL